MRNQLTVFSNRIPPEIYDLAKKNAWFHRVLDRHLQTDGGVIDVWQLLADAVNDDRHNKVTSDDYWWR